MEMSGVLCTTDFEKIFSAQLLFLLFRNGDGKVGLHDGIQKSFDRIKRKKKEI